MLRSDNAHDGIIHSDMRLEKQADGKFKAFFPAHANVPPAIGRDECEAVNLAKAALQKAHAEGQLGNG